MPSSRVDKLCALFYHHVCCYLHNLQREDARGRVALINKTVVAVILSCCWLCSGQRAATSGYPLPQHGTHGMVASASSIASAVGLDILKHGGNAVDAAVAVGLALSVAYPVAGNLGGGGFMMIRMADGRVAAIDYREEAPAKASHDMYIGKDGKLVPRLSTSGYLASGVPGTVAGLSLALSKFGTISWAAAIEPARKLAADGLTVSYSLAASLQHSQGISGFPEGKRIFQRDGKFYQEGEILKQPELAATLERLEMRGPREFYEGQTAQYIAGDMRDHGGLITLEDLKNYKAVMRQPLKGTYRGYEVVSMPPPSSGGIALLEMLNILEYFKVDSMGYNSSGNYRLMLEAMRRAFADRAEFLGDPDFVKVPWSGLISKKYAGELAKSIDLNRATPSTEIGHGNPVPYESSETTQFTVVDGTGNAVSNTYTLNGGYGSGVVVKGAGFFLNNEMDDFAAKPGVPNMYGLIQGEANSVAAHKRPLSAMTPSFVLKDGKLFLATGSPGGPTIINTVLQVIVNVIDHKMNVQQAVNAPRIHHQWMPDEIRFEPFGMPDDARKVLETAGYHFANRASYMGDAESVLVAPGDGMLWGASDPRNPDAAALGY
jgi:gamma-glutamyltranspeptidase/glutathione hydrolase